MKFKAILALVFIIFSALIQAQTTVYEAGQNKMFVFEHTVNRLFSTSTYRVLRPYDFAFTIGSNFNDSGIENFNSSIGIGLGVFIELQVKTVPQNFTLINPGTNESIGGAKIKLFNENVYFPGVSIGAETNFNNVSFAANESEIQNIFPDEYDFGLKELRFEANSVKIYGVMTKRVFGTTNLTLGLSYDVVRIQNVYARIEISDVRNEEPESMANINYFGGIDFAINERTKFLFEIFSGTNLLFNLEGRTMRAKRKTTISVGMRTFMNEWFTIDYGLTYIDTFKNWEEIQLRMGLTAFFNLGI